MKKSRFNGAKDYLALLVRRRWWAAGATIFLAGLFTLTAVLVPKIYVSETMILIQPREIHAEFVKDLIAGSTEQRLSTIEQTVLSRTNLLKIIAEYQDRMPAYQNLSDERKVARMRNAIQVQFDTERRSSGTLPNTNFKISYRDYSPALAQMITARMAALFIEQDNQARVAQVSGTADFFASELRKVADQLRQSDARLRTLNEGHRFELPDERDISLRTLDRLQLQKNATREALDRFRSMQMTLERQISETPQFIQQSALAKADVSKLPQRNTLLERYLSKKQEYAEALANKTPQHPDVVRLKWELDQLLKQIPPQELAASGAIQETETPRAADNPVYKSLKDQLAQLETDIEIREKEKKNIEAEMARHNERIQSLPQVEQSLAAAKRENANLMKLHEDLKSKFEQAKLSESLESRPSGSQFEIVDSANFPLDSITPKRSMLALVGLAASLTAGFLMAWMVDALRPKIWTQRELERYTENPVLVEIPSIVTTRDQRLRARAALARGLVSVLLIICYLGGLYYLYINQGLVVRVLNPVAEILAERFAK